MYFSKVAREPNSPLDAVLAYHGRTSKLFWRHFGGLPVLAGKRVLDFGCSTGGMLHYLLEAGAEQAIGVDLSVRAGQYAQAHLAPLWGSRADVRIGDIRKMDLEPVDVIVSQNTLEHVIELESVVLALVDKCKPGGDIFFGFGPLWYSPYGNHWYPNSSVPWNHLIRGEGVVLESYAAAAGRPVRSIASAGFNGAKPDRYMKLFDALPVEIVSLRTNVADGMKKCAAMSLMRAASRLPGMDKFFTINIFAHLKKV